MKNREKKIAEEFFNKRNIIPEAIIQSKEESNSIDALLTLNKPNGLSTDPGINRLTKISTDPKKDDFSSPVENSSIELSADMEEE
ncbi:hypothetical protein AYI70_g12175 [Smittium culicis]|uniref:Uncharacterized protein n=1 Tax=Smittium culicis TaxID=133412 RepID=A0A1R1WYP8_9FUNG|nr:hypothetical protein AYI70_g12175 [Smittium culicis]